MEYSGYKDEWILGDFFIYLIMPEPTSRGKYFDGKLYSIKSLSRDDCIFRSELYDLGRLLCALSELRLAHGLYPWVLLLRHLLFAKSTHKITAALRVFLHESQRSVPPSKRNFVPTTLFDLFRSR